MTPDSQLPYQKLLHIPVLCREVIETLLPVQGGFYLDATLGLGGHARKILESAPGSQICGLDRDTKALEKARVNLEKYADRVHFFHLPFSRYREALDSLGWKGVDGVIADLGVSSMQLDQQERGFSFQHDGPLDMRMDQQNDNLTASEIINRYCFDELKNLFSIYGEEPQAGRIARHILDYRQKGKISSTLELAKIIEKAYPAKWRKTAKNNPATRTFQAIRIHVNKELDELKIFLDSILQDLKLKARLAIISFHSLEDRMVKNAMREWSKTCICPPQAQKCECHHTPEAKILYKKPVVATPEEMAENPRARSAKLRAIEKISDNNCGTS